MTSGSKQRYPQRALHLIDIENLAGNPVPGPIDVLLVRYRYHKRVGFRANDQAIVGCNHLAFRHAGFSWPGVRYLVRSGENGADLELLDVIRHENVAERFSHVVIASGDGIFAAEAAGLAAKGCHLTVASRREALSKRLRLAAHRVIYLDAPDMRTTPATAPSPFRPAA
jgi:hypothetical protein